MDDPDVSIERARDEVTRALGERPSRAKLVPTGEYNRVYYLQVPSGEVFAKFGPREGTLVEARAYRAAGAAGFPVPEILAEETPDEPWAFFVTRAAAGVQMPNLNEPQRSRAARALGDALRSLHSIPATGFGGVSAERLFDDGVWAAGADGSDRLVRQTEWGLAYLTAQGLIAADEADAIRAALAARAIGVDGPSCLLHGDLATDAAYADPQTGELTAVIDFGDVTCGPPAWEFVPVAVHDARSLAAVLDGYGLDLEDVRPVLAAGTLSRATLGARWVHERGLDRMRPGRQRFVASPPIRPSRTDSSR